MPYDVMTLGQILVLMLVNKCMKFYTVIAKIYFQYNDENKDSAAARLMTIPQL